MKVRSETSPATLIPIFDPKIPLKHANLIYVKIKITSGPFPSVLHAEFSLSLITRKIINFNSIGGRGGG